MTNKSVLILQGGWKGHEPELVAARFARILEKHGYSCTISGTLSPLEDAEALMALDLLVFCWTQDEVEKSVMENVSKAVGSGVGLAGCHGGLCDAFRKSTMWQFMTGGQWVSHPGGDGVRYTVNIRHGSSPLVEGIGDFEVCSEHYYLHIDPAIEVLATTRFPVVPYYHCANKPVDIPQVWTKFWGNGRVFYNALGHHDDVFEKFPQAETLMERGLLWAAGGKAYAADHCLTTERFENTAKMF
jgi:type 1 glutamine amidotransferase